MKCQVCRQRFSAERSDARTCSSRCRQRAYRPVYARRQFYKLFAQIAVL
jgi:hypothetical protein